MILATTPTVVAWWHSWLQPAVVLGALTFLWANISAYRRKYRNEGNQKDAEMKTFREDLSYIKGYLGLPPRPPSE